MTQEMIDKVKAAGREDLLKTLELNASGYAGMNSKGHIVDRRIEPDAIPILENARFGVPKPKQL